MHLLKWQSQIDPDIYWICENGIKIIEIRILKIHFDELNTYYAKHCWICKENSAELRQKQIPFFSGILSYFACGLVTGNIATLRYVSEKIK